MNERGKKRNRKKEIGERKNAEIVGRTYCIQNIASCDNSDMYNDTSRPLSDSRITTSNESPSGGCEGKSIRPLFRMEHLTVYNFPTGAKAKETRLKKVGDAGALSEVARGVVLSADPQLAGIAGRGLITMGRPLSCFAQLSPASGKR